MTEPSEDISLDAALNHAIDDVLHNTVNEYTTRWVAVIESIDEDGARGVWTLTSPGAIPSDVLGLIEFAKMRQNHAMLADLE